MLEDYARLVEKWYRCELLVDGAIVICVACDYDYDYELALRWLA
jgi:hypothetical protein